MACVRQAAAQGLGVYVARRGAEERGTVLLKINMLGGGFKVLTQARDLEGRLIWIDPYEGQETDEAKIDAYLKRAIERDPDVWVVEVEDKLGRNPFLLT